MMNMNEDLLVVKDLKKHFKINKNSTLKAVDGINFTIKKGRRSALLVSQDVESRLSEERLLKSMSRQVGKFFLLMQWSIQKVVNKSRKRKSAICK